MEEIDAVLAEVVGRDRWSEADARVILDACRESGEARTRFCRRHGIRDGRLAWWASQLKRRGGSKRSKGGAGLSFHRVRVIGDKRKASSERPETFAASRLGKIEIVLDGGRSVLVPPGFAPKDLEHAPEVLGSLRS